MLALAKDIRYYGHEHALDPEFSMDDDWLVPRIAGFRAQEVVVTLSFEELHSGLVVDQCNNDFSRMRRHFLPDKHEVTVLDAGLVHGISVCSQEEIFPPGFRDLR